MLLARASVVAFAVLLGSIGCSSQPVPTEMLVSAVDVTITMNDGIDEKINIELEEVEFREALGLVVEEAGCVVIERNRTHYTIHQPPRVYGSMGSSIADSSIRCEIDAIVKRAGVVIVVDPDVVCCVSRSWRSLPWRDHLELICATQGYVVVEENGGLRVKRRDESEGLTTQRFRLRAAYPQRGRAAKAMGVSELVVALRRVLTPYLGTLHEIILERRLSLTASRDRAVPLDRRDPQSDRPG